MILPYIKKNAEKIKEKLLIKDVISLQPIGEKKGNLLLSYITLPFQSKRVIDISQVINLHTNIWECLEISKIWRENGFAVDIIEYQNCNFTPKKEYDFFIDIHTNLERLAPLMSKDCIKILHITGSHWLFQNTAEYQRLHSIQQRRGVTLTPRRLAYPSFGIEHADYATVLGSGFVISTFKYAKKPIFSLPLPSSKTFSFFKDKQFKDCRNNFIWFGSSGMIHKGLDLVLEAFSQMPDLHLTVCGPVKNESDFEEAYFQELYHLPNITTLGWISIQSDTFQNLLEKSVGLIYPSCSEGTAGSVVICLHGGLIPIISPQSGIDVKDFGIILNDSTVEEIKKSVRLISQLPEPILKQMSFKAWEYANSNYTREIFSKKYREFVNLMIAQKGSFCGTFI